MLAAMRMDGKTDPELSDAARLRRRGLLKTASVASAFGMFMATTLRPEFTPGTAHHRVITSEGVVTLNEGRAERPGPWAFPPGAALVEGAAPARHA
jgi:hypothetical protein